VLGYEDYHNWLKVQGISARQMDLNGRRVFAVARSAACQRFSRPHPIRCGTNLATPYPQAKKQRVAVEQQPFVSAQLELVAGAGFEPATFGL
jgi:hypothetical protein